MLKVLQVNLGKAGNFMNVFDLELLKVISQHQKLGPLLAS
jgi:hypothetical protein